MEKLPLIDYLAQKARCTYISDLRKLKRTTKFDLIDAVQQIPEEAYSMDDWNEALMYMSNREARYSSFTAKEEILEFLKYLMDSKHLNDDIKRKAKGITLIQLNMEDLREVKLIIPPVEHQKIFVNFAKKINKSKLPTSPQKGGIAC